MLREMYVMTRAERIQNKQIGGTGKVLGASSKGQEQRLQWYGHMRRREEDYVGVRGRRSGQA